MWKLSFAFIAAILANAQQPTTPQKLSVLNFSLNPFPCLPLSNFYPDAYDDDYGRLCNNCRPIHTSCRDYPNDCTRPEIMYFVAPSKCTRAIVSCSKLSDDPKTRLVTESYVSIAEGLNLEKVVHCIDGRWYAKESKSPDMTEFLTLRCVTFAA